MDFQFFEFQFFGKIMEKQWKTMKKHEEPPPSKPIGWGFGVGVGRFLSAAPAASPKIHGVGNPWKILGKSRVFGNSDFGKKSRFENKLAVFRKVLKV